MAKWTILLRKSRAAELHKKIFERDAKNSALAKQIKEVNKALGAATTKQYVVVRKIGKAPAKTPKGRRARASLFLAAF